MEKMTANPHRGSGFDSFLQEEGLYEEVTAGAVKKVLAWQAAQTLEKEKAAKTDDELIEA